MSLARNELGLISQLGGYLQTIEADGDPCCCGCRYARFDLCVGEGTIYICEGALCTSGLSIIGKTLLINGQCYRESVTVGQRYTHSQLPPGSTHMGESGEVFACVRNDGQCGSPCIPTDCCSKSCRCSKPNTNPLSATVQWNMSWTDTLPAPYKGDVDYDYSAIRTLSGVAATTNSHSGCVHEDMRFCEEQIHTYPPPEATQPPDPPPVNPPAPPPVILPDDPNTAPVNPPPIGPGTQFTGGPIPIIETGCINVNYWGCPPLTAQGYLTCGSYNPQIPWVYDNANFVIQVAGWRRNPRATGGAGPQLARFTIKYNHASGRSSIHFDQNYYPSLAEITNCSVVPIVSGECIIGLTATWDFRYLHDTYWITQGHGSVQVVLNEVLGCSGSSGARQNLVTRINDLLRAKRV